MNRNRRVRLALACACLAIFLPVITANAQTRNAINLKIPFAFILQGETFQPGEYTIARASQTDPRTFVLKNGESGEVVRFRTQRVEGEPSEKLKVVFNRYGERYFLSELWWKGNENGRQVTPCPEELEARDRSAKESDAPKLSRVVITD